MTEKCPLILKKNTSLITYYRMLQRNHLARVMIAYRLCLLHILNNKQTIPKISPMAAKAHIDTNRL
jgi:hypothetical protein